MTNFNFEAKAIQQVLYVFGVRADTVSKEDIVTACMKIKGQIKAAETLNEGLDSENINKDIAEYKEQLKALVNLLDSGDYKKD